MRSAQAWLAEYGESHRNPTNKLIHWICVPLIYWSVFALLWDLPRPAFMSHPLANWGMVLLVLAQVYYVALSIKLSIGLLLVNIGVVAATWWIDTNVGVDLWKLALGVFVVAWIFQFVGHEIEGKKPSFLRDVQFLMIGPAWLVGHIYRRLGVGF